jgi:hypothetical protein
MVALLGQGARAVAMTTAQVDHDVYQQHGSLTSAQTQAFDTNVMQVKAHYSSNSTEAKVFNDFSTVSTYYATPIGQYCEAGSEILDASVCEAAAAALGFTWSGTFYGYGHAQYCQLSAGQVYFNTAGASRPNPSPTKASICSSPTTAVPGGYAMHADMGSGSGGVILEMTDTTVLQCADACDQLPSCVAFTMLDDSTRCKLKSAVTLTSASGKDTYVKQASTPASATGDPHLQNVHGERFDLMKEGKHVLISIPRGQNAEGALLRVLAKARRLGGKCADIYFQEVNVTGSWAEAKQVGGYHHSVSQSNVRTPEWVAFGKVELKVVHGSTDSGLRYLNVYVKHLGRAGFVVGGLLGEDDHGDVITPPKACAQLLTLAGNVEGDVKSPSAHSVAVASLA